jgi:hypothetical protein
MPSAGSPHFFTFNLITRIIFDEEYKREDPHCATSSFSGPDALLSGISNTVNLRICFSRYENSSFTPTRKNKQDCSSVHFILHSFDRRRKVQYYHLMVGNIPHIYSTMNIFMNGILICNCLLSLQNILIYPHFFKDFTNSML